MIHKLELENYRCYSSFVKDFNNGLNIISGSNGTGKTSIVEAIGFALFGNKITRGKANSWVRHGHKHGKVILHIDNYIITRGDNEQLVEDDEGNVLARQHSGVDEWMENTYGLNYDLYCTANYIAQKDIESFSGLQPAERLKRVEKLLRIDVIDNILKRVKAGLTTTRRELKDYTSKTYGSTYEEGSVTKAKRDLELAEDDYAAADAEYSQALISHGAYTQQLKQWNRLQEVTNQVAALKYTKFDMSQEEMLKLRDNLQESEKAVKQLKKFKDIEGYNHSENLEKLRDLYASTKSRLDEVLEITNECTVCGQNIPDNAYLKTLIATLTEDLQKIKDKGALYKKQTEKAILEEKIIDSEYDYKELVRMINDYNSRPLVLELEQLQSTTEPEKVDISDIELLKRSKWKSLNNARNVVVDAEKNKSVHETYGDLIQTTKNNLESLEKLSKFTDNYRKEFTKNVVPLIHDNAEKIFNYLTSDKYSNFRINQDYSVEGYDVYSGSEADAASFAIRMAIAKTSRIKTFNSIILDEISASFDTQKEELLIDLLKQGNNQIIYISHGDIV